jgi:hypothetical protein
MRIVTESRESFEHVQIGDSEADVCLSDDSMIANHVSGQGAWDLLVRGAQAANSVILPMGCPTLLTMPGQLEQLPEGLDEDVVMVGSGTDLRAVIEAT